MKKFLSIFTAASMLLAMTACSSPADSSASDSSSAADSSASAAQTAESSQPGQQESSEAGESSAAPTAEADDARTDYEKMVDRSLLSVGDMTRMSDVFQKAQNGEDITVAYIGGSITEGYNAGTTEFYAKTCTDLLQGYFPDITVTGVNAGISGTPSLLGNLRLERDVLSADPDIVFVEFAVNDGQEADYKNAYESLVRTLLTQVRDTLDIPVVLMEPFVLEVQPGQAEWREDLDPKIDVLRRLAREFGCRLVPLDGLFAAECCRTPAELLAADGVHPTEKGAALIARAFVEAIK